MTAPNIPELANQFKISEEKVRQLLAIFDQFDADKDGCVTEQEIAGCIKENLELNAMQHVGKAHLASMVKSIIRVADKDGDGKMEFPEFLAVLAPQYKAAEKKAELEQTFRELDVNGDGFIDAAELRAAWQRNGDHLSHQEAEAMIAACDGDGDGKATLAEFKKMMSH